MQKKKKEKKKENLFVGDLNQKLAFNVMKNAKNDCFCFNLYIKCFHLEDCKHS
jgi:hypothetical protein